MSVDQMAAEIAVARKMKLTHAVRRDGLQISQRVKAVIYAADIDIVDVEQDGAFAQALRQLASDIQSEGVARARRTILGIAA